jgi:S1-C subfamily serine protease
MSKEEREKRRQLMRVAIPAAVCLVAIVAIALGTRAWQPGTAQGALPPMELRGQWLGMRLAATNSQSAAELGVPAEVRGIVVAEVQSDSRAVFAGLAPGDVLTRVNGKEVANLLDMYTLSSRLDATRPLQMEFLRAGRPMTTNVAPPEPMMPQAAAWAGARAPAAPEGAWPGARAYDPAQPQMRRDAMRMP